ncbi:kinase-like protein [Ceratobasidium sp. AG-I]|nr:kinase-like protein [Ceratobasidium sp. AG-I]
MAEIDQTDSVSGTMSAPEIITILGKHGCPDITGDIDLAQCSSKPIAGGGFGDIFRGFLQSGVQVAIKCPRLYIDASEENHNILKTAAREIYTWSKCKHDHVLELTGLAYFREQIAMVSPWMMHGTLQQHLIRQPDSDRCDICKQIASGLVYLHSIDMVHGDMKAANILVSEGGVAKLTDFGNTVLKSHTLSFTGTTSTSNFSLRWTAPEVLEGTTGHMKQADVYALGMTILEVITGKVPFHGRSEVVVLGDVTVRKRLPLRPETAIPISSQHGDTLWDLLTRCWNFDSRYRPSAVQVQRQIACIDRGGLIRLETPVGSPALANPASLGNVDLFYPFLPPGIPGLHYGDRSPYTNLYVINQPVVPEEIVAPRTSSPSSYTVRTSSSYHTARTSASSQQTKSGGRAFMVRPWAK